MFGATPPLFMSALFNIRRWKGWPHGLRIFCHFQHHEALALLEPNRLYAVRHPVQHPLDEENISNGLYADLAQPDISLWDDRKACLLHCMSLFQSTFRLVLQSHAS